MGKPKSFSAALIIGFTIQGLAIARALSAAGITAYALVDRNSGTGVLRHPVFYSNNVRFIFTESIAGEKIVESLLAARRSIRESEVVLYPVTDNTVMALAKDWPVLEPYYLLSWADYRHRIELIVNKSNLPELCERAGVDYPRTVTIRSESDMESCLAHLSLPLLLKPERQVFAFKTHRCDTPGEFKRFVRSHVKVGPLIAQEWIEGAERNLFSYTCFALKGREYFGFTGRKVRTSPPGVGIATVIETENEPDVFQAAQNLLPIFDLSGPVAMEFKKDRSGRLRFIEANVGRTEFCVDLGIQAGFNLPYVEFCHATGIALPPVQSWVECVWFDTDKEPFCYSSLCLKERTLKPHGKEPVFPYHSRERWRVRLAAAIEIIRKVTIRAVRKLDGFRFRSILTTTALVKSGNSEVTEK